MPARRDDRGQTLPLVALTLALALVLAAAVAHLAVQTTRRAQAAHAADAAALAGAIADRAAAEHMARANGAELVAYERSGDRVVVEVVRGEHNARAAAEAVVEVTGG
jgi:outer membrane lipoprotein SlyB